LIARRPVCAAPRGIAFDAANARLVVACAGGEIVALPEGDGDAKVLSKIDRDLRDVIVVPKGATFVTTFRTAELLRLDDSGAVVSRMRSPDVPTNGDPESIPDGQADIAWRTVIASPVSIVMVHQRARNPGAPPVSTSAGGYSGNGPCSLSIASAAISSFELGSGESPVPAPRGALSQAVLPVDVAAMGDTLAVVAAGNGHTPELPRVYFIDHWHAGSGGDCFDAFSSGIGKVEQPNGQPIAVAFTPGGQMVVQLREPSALVVYTGPSIKNTVDLGGASREDTGHAIFHSNAGGFIACASCHAEGGEDGRTWSFDTVGARRTQSLRGGVLGAGPYHWDGELPDLHALCGEVLHKRMSGADLGDDQEAALARWLAAIPSIPHSTPDDRAAVDRGRYLFADDTVGCMKCHAGETLTNHEMHDVGTGHPFKVPSLRGVEWRAPFLHDGCAVTLEARFQPACGGGDKHGTTSQLSNDQISDLVAFLNTL
jgi:hypothetical protein